MRKARWTEVLMSCRHPHCRYTSESGHQKCRSCASQSPCTSEREKDRSFVQLSERYWTIHHKSVKWRLLVVCGHKSWTILCNLKCVPGGQTQVWVLHQRTCPRSGGSTCWHQCHSSRSHFSGTCCFWQRSPNNGLEYRSASAGSRCTSCGMSAHWGRSKRNTSQLYSFHLLHHTLRQPIDHDAY